MTKLRRILCGDDGDTVGRGYLLMAALLFVFGGLLALGMRWKLAWPDAPVPILSWFHDWPGGRMPAETYAKTFTLHGTLMMWGVVVPAIAWGLGLACVPSLSGAQKLALGGLATTSLWLTIVGASVLLVGWASSGWTAYAPLGSKYELMAKWVPFEPDAASWLRIAQGSGWDARQSPWAPLALYVNLITTWVLAASLFVRLTAGRLTTLLAIATAGIAAVAMTVGLQFVAFDGQTAWFTAVGIWAIAGILASIPILATVATRPGHHRLPLAVWGWSGAAAIGLLAGPVLLVAMAANLLDAHNLTAFFDASRGGQPLLHQHLFWFYAHPLVYLMILPAYGIVSDALASATGRNVRDAWGYRSAAASIVVISLLGFAVWAHHMFQSGLDPSSALVFSAASILIATPTALLTLHWIATLWTGRLDRSAAGWGGIAFVSLFVIGGLSGVILAAPAINIHLHDSYFVVAHLHYTLFGGALFGLFTGLYHHWPTLFPGRRLNGRLGRWHIVLTYLAFNGTFGAMHWLGMAGMPRRYADPTTIPMFAKYAPWQQVMTICAVVLGFSQFLLLANIILSLGRGRSNAEAQIAQRESKVEK